MIREFLLTTLAATNIVAFNYNFTSIDDYKWNSNGIINKDAVVEMTIRPYINVKKENDINSGTLRFTNRLINESSSIDLPLMYYYQDTKDVLVVDIPYNKSYSILLNVGITTFTINDLQQFFVYFNQAKNVYAMKFQNSLYVSLFGSQANIKVLSYSLIVSYKIKYNGNVYVFSNIDIGVETTKNNTAFISKSDFSGVRIVDNNGNVLKAENNSNSYNLDPNKLNIVTFFPRNQSYLYVSELQYNIRQGTNINRYLNTSINESIYTSTYYFGGRTISDGAIAPPSSNDDLIPIKDCNGPLDIPCQVGNGLATLVNNIPFVSTILKNIKSILQVPILLFEKVFKGLFGLWI